jgi:arylsulfatase A-like enzyme
MSDRSTPNATPPRWSDAALIVFVAALAGALAEFALILGARIALQRYAMLNPQGVWLAPIANVLLIAPVALVVWLAVRRVRPHWALPGVAAAATFLAALAPLLVFKGRIHPIAMWLLAAGIAAQIARLVMARPRLARRLAAWGTAGLGLISLAGGIGFNVTRAVQERRAVARLGDAPNDAPNVLLLVLDTVRALSLSAYGYERATSPVLAALAQRGVRFDRAVATAPWTLPTHASLFTGRYPHEMSAGWSVPLDGTFPTLAERLTSMGYSTGGFAANLRYCSYEFGITRGFGYYRDYDVSVSEMWRSSSITSAFGLWLTQRLGGYNAPGRLWADRMNERLLAWLDDEALRERERPFFAFVNYYDAHGPYDPPEAPFDTLFSGKEPPTRDSGSRDFTAEEVAGLLDAYDASIAYLDRELGRLFAALEQRGLLENTIVIVTSDHGEEFNEHGQMNHGNTLYFPSVHVPLIVAGPGIPRGVQVADPVTLRDVPATVLEFVRAGVEAQLPGRSLSAFWRAASDSSGGAERSPVFAEVDYARNLPASIPVSQGAMKSVVEDGHHLIRAADGAEELFDVRSDPWERRNLMRDTSRSGILERARALIQQARDRDVRRDEAPVRPAR